VTYYYVAPHYYCVPGPTVIPVPDAPKYARPTPAPPSSTGEPPLQKKTSDDPRKPVIVASHALNDNSKREQTSSDRCRVGFWNLTGRDLTLRVAGKTMAIPRDRGVTLTLDRQFIWQIDGRSERMERVAEGQATHEVVIRD
jgi:hypothetical protein